MPELIPRRVVCAAMRHRETGLIVCGARHRDPIMRAQTHVAGGGRKFWLNVEQGFIDQEGLFLTRREAHVIAKEQGQIIRRCGGDKNELYSENLYSSTPRVVVCAAIRQKVTGLIICGARHGDVVMDPLMQITGGFDFWAGKRKDGFIDQFGTFLTREEAFPIAEKEGQIRRRYPEDEGYLFSENLY